MPARIIHDEENRDRKMRGLRRGECQPFVSARLDPGIHNGGPPAYDRQTVATNFHARSAGIRPLAASSCCPVPAADWLSHDVHRAESRLRQTSRPPIRKRTSDDGSGTLATSDPPPLANRLINP